MVHVNQIAVLSHSGQVMNLMRGQGTVYHRLLPSNSFASSADSKVKRQFQQPAFSHQGRYLALAEMHFKDSSVVRSDALVFEVPKESQSFGASDSMPLFASGDLPGAPFFMRFSPDDETLAMLCSQPAATQPPQQAKSEGESEGTNATPSASASASASSEVTTSLVLLDWARYQRRDEWGRNSAMPGNRNPAKANAPRPPGLAARKALTVLRGSPVFFTYTTSSAKNATIVAHCQQEVSDPQTQSMVTERAVWLLQRGDTSGVADFSWKKISAEAAGATPSVRWSTPICHSAGGGDSVLLVEDGWLVSKSLSRWKRGQEDALPRTKKLMQVRGAVQFLVSADSSRAVVLQEDIAGGFFRLSVLEGEKGLDPCDPSPPVFYDLPCPKLTVAFWLSPDSTKVLLLTAAGRTVEDVSVQKGQTRVALNSDMQWSVFNFPLRELREYEAFKPTPYFMKVSGCGVRGVGGGVSLLFCRDCLFALLGRCYEFTHPFPPSPPSLPPLLLCSPLLPSDPRPLFLAVRASFQPLGPRQPLIHICDAHGAHAHAPRGQQTLPGRGQMAEPGRVVRHMDTALKRE